MKPRNLERNIGEELTQAAKEIKAHKEGKLHPKVVSNDIILARKNLMFTKLNQWTISYVDNQWAALSIDSVVTYTHN